METGQHGTGDIGALVRGELAAVETYKQALDSVGDVAAGELRRIEGEHEQAVDTLQEYMAEWDMPPPVSPGPWGTWAKAVEGTAKVFGAKTAIRALKEGEEHGLDEYEEALRNEELNTEIREIITSQLLPRTREHVAALDRLLQAV